MKRSDLKTEHHDLILTSLHRGLEIGWITLGGGIVTGAFAVLVVVAVGDATGLSLWEAAGAPFLLGALAYVATLTVAMCFALLKAAVQLRRQVRLGQAMQPQPPPQNAPAGLFIRATAQRIRRTRLRLELCGTPDGALSEAKRIIGRYRLQTQRDSYADLALSDLLQQVASELEHCKTAKQRLAVLDVVDRRGKREALESRIEQRARFLRRLVRIIAAPVDWAARLFDRFLPPSDS